MSKHDWLPINYEEATWQERRKAREEYIRVQDGKCAYCGKALTGQPARKVMRSPINWYLFPEGFQKYPVHLHHDHMTGMTIGAIHMRCNAHSWQYKGI